MNEVIVSIYDSGYNWSVRIYNKTYTRDAMCVKPIRFIKNIYSDVYSYIDKSLIFDKYDIDRLIVCEDGNIEIYEKENNKL